MAEQRALMSTCTAFRVLWLKPGQYQAEDDALSAQEAWQQQARDAAAAALAERLICKSLLRRQSTQEPHHPDFNEEYVQLDGVLHLSEHALQYLMRQEPVFLHELGAAFAIRWTDSHTFELYRASEEMYTANVVFSLALVHHHASLSPHEIAKLEQFVLDMPLRLSLYKPEDDESARVASCCWLRGPGGCLPLFWRLEYCFTFHGELR